MTIDTYTLAIFSAGLLAGVGLALLARCAQDGLFIVRYLRQKSQDPESRGQAANPARRS